MGESPQTLGKSNLARAGGAGVVLALLGIGCFVLLYSLLGEVGQVQRLLISLCSPPALMALVVGAYMLIAASRARKD